MKSPSFTLITLTTLLLLLGPATSCGDETAAAEPSAQPIRALFILGGEHHPYEGGSKILADHLAEKMEITIDFVRIDNPPKGCPRAEKATIASNPSILDDPDLHGKYDIILAYNQEAYTNLTPKQRDGLLHFVRSGGPWVGMHSAGDFLKTSPDYVKMVGGKFQTHPPFGEMKVRRILGDHPILEGVEDFITKDEFYYMTDCGLGDKHVLLVGEGPNDGKTRPVAWTKRYGKGKVFYTVLGHALESFRNENFLKLLHNAVLWALRPEVGDAGPDGWISLFNGRDFEGWTFCGPGSFEIEKDSDNGKAGCLKTVGGMGLLWFDRIRFRDFTLVFDWKVARAEDNSGVFVRFPTPPHDPWGPVSEGYEIQICDTAAPKHNTGSVYSFQAPSQIASNPAGEWNRFEITVVGQKYTVVLNGTTVVDGFEGDRGREGFIGFQNHDPQVTVRFRNIRAKIL